MAEPNITEGPYTIIDGQRIRLVPARPEPVSITIERALAPILKRLEALEAREAKDATAKAAKAAKEK